MGLVRTMVTTLFLSAWLMVHAVFLANLPPEDAVEKKLLPLQIPSVFHLPWFRTLVWNHMNTDLLRFDAAPPQQKEPPTSVWASLFSESSSGAGRSSRRQSHSYRSSSSGNKGVVGAAAVPSSNAEDLMRFLSWAVTAMTMAEWLTFAYLLWRILWMTILRPLVVVVSFVFLLLLAFYCLKGYYYAIGATTLSPEEASVVVPYITAIDEFLHAAGNALLSWNGRVLHGLDRLLSAVFTPAAVLERQQQDKQQLLLGKKQQNAPDIMSVAASVFDFLHRVQRMLAGGPLEGISVAVRPSAGGMSL